MWYRQVLKVVTSLVTSLVTSFNFFTCHGEEAIAAPHHGFIPNGKRGMGVLGGKGRMVSGLI